MWDVPALPVKPLHSAAATGLNGLTMALAKELTPSNIQVNAVACGVIDTDKRMSGVREYSLGIEIRRTFPGTPEETADLVFDLAETIRT